MPDRAVPPRDIDPETFFVDWVPRMVAADAERRSKLSDTIAVLEFTLDGDGGGIFAVHLGAGDVRGSAGPVEAPDLQITLHLETWERLNTGELSAPDAFLRRKVKLQGNLSLALKLHLILG